MKKNFIVTLLLLAIVVLGEYLIWAKVVEPNEVKNFDLKEAKKLVDKFYTDDYIITTNVFKDGMTERYKLSMAFAEGKRHVTEEECSELYPDNQKDDDGIIVGDGTYCDGKASVMNYPGLASTYRELFGKDAKAAKKTVGVFNYIEEKNLFVYLSCRCGGVDNTKYIYDVKDATLKGNKLTINVYYYELIPEEGKEDEEIDTKKFISENKDKMSIYQMTFNKENKKFKLYEVKKVS